MYFIFTGSPQLVALVRLEASVDSGKGLGRIRTVARAMEHPGVASVVLQLLAFRVVDILLTGLPQRIQDGEVSAAVLLVGAKLSTALILAAALTG